MSERVMTAHVPIALARQVDELSDRLDRPRGWIVKEALARYVEAEAERYQLTLEALGEVDRGQTVGHAEVEAWPAGLRPRAKRGKR